MDHHRTRRVVGAVSPRAAFRTLLASALALLLLGVVPRAVAAQWCVGSPNIPGQFSMGLYVDLMDEGTGYGIQSTANLENPFAIGATLGTANLDDLESNLTVASAMGLMELPFPRMTVCPVLELQWATVSENLQGGTVDVDQWIFPLGVSGGTQLALSPTLDLLPSARLGLLHMRTSFSAAEFASESESATEFFLDAGATLSITPFFLRGSLRWISGDDPDMAFDTLSGTAFGLLAGLRF